MGLIKAALGSAGSILGDQWREYFYCDSMDADVLMTKGTKRTSSRSSNTKGSDNIISNGAVIAVNEGQCMLIVEQGKVVEFAAEAGEFTWDSSTEGSVFYGGFGEGLKDSWQNLKRRFTFGADTAKDQRIYFINTKEIMGNKYGTPAPVPFRVVDRNIGLDMDVSIRCNGEYSYRISDPLVFYQRVAGNVSSTFYRSQIDGALKTDFLTALQPAFARISEMGIRYSSLPAHTYEIAEAMNQALSTKWTANRGISVVTVGVNSVTASAEDESTIKELQKTAVFRNAGMGAAYTTMAQGEAMKAAAANEHGAMMGFMGMNLAQQAGGVNATQLYQMASRQQNEPAASVSPAAKTTAVWKCVCGTENTGKFCVECGAKKPEKTGWTCSCGSVNKGKFCPECGAKKPAAEPLYACDKCGWEPEDPKNPPKFCPECGDRFDSNDIK